MLGQMITFTPKAGAVQITFSAEAALKAKELLELIDLNDYVMTDAERADLDEMSFQIRTALGATG